MTGTAPSGVVVSIHTVQRRNGVAEAVPEASVVADYGIQGDFRSRHNSDRQLTLIEEESLQATGSVWGMTYRRGPVAGRWWCGGSHWPRPWAGQSAPATSSSPWPGPAIPATTWR